MSDTVLFGRTVLTGTNKAMLLYVANAIALAIGGALMTLDEKDWNAWWWAKRAGWMFILVGNITNTIKAFYSNSNPSAKGGA